MLSIHSNTNPDSQDLDIERPGDIPVFKKQLEDLSDPEFQKSVNVELICSIWIKLNKLFDL